MERTGHLYKHVDIYIALILMRLSVNLEYSDTQSHADEIIAARKQTGQ